MKQNTRIYTRILLLLSAAMLNTFGACGGSSVDPGKLILGLYCYFNPQVCADAASKLASNRPQPVSCPSGCGPGYCDTIYYCGTDGCYTQGEWKYDPNSKTCGKSVLGASGSQCFNCGVSPFGNDAAYFSDGSKNLSSQMLLPGSSILRLRESIQIQFSQSMDPAPPQFGGSLLSQNSYDFRWQKTTRDNDTLLIFPSSSWQENAAGANLTVQASTLTRENIDFSISFSRIGEPPPPPPPPVVNPAPAPPPCDALCLAALCIYTGKCF